MSNTVKGYKVFNPDWTCRKKKYTCPGKFEEDVNLGVCKRGMHFCEKLRDCFGYYKFDPKNKVAEVIAYGDVITEDNKSCTNKLEIVRELSWVEVLDMVNCGVGNTGIDNAGRCNTGNRNTGNRNTGDWNTGDCNTGDWNTGDCNTGGWNTGGWNTGDFNAGDCNTGGCNTGDYNAGNYNTGDYNFANRSTGCFNTQEQKIYMFDKPTDWTRLDWRGSDAYTLLLNMPKMDWTSLKDMTDAEKKQHPESETTGGYLKKASDADRQKWWDKLPDKKKGIIKALPNFDPEIFKKITGIDVEEEK